MSLCILVGLRSLFPAGSSVCSHSVLPVHSHSLPSSCHVPAVSQICKFFWIQTLVSTCSVFLLRFLTLLNKAVDCFEMLHPRPCLHFGPHLNHTLTRTWFQAAILPSYREQNSVEHLYLPHINMSTFPHFSFTPLASHAYKC
ncbi:hypothetical protein GOODEAATRI_018992 [Goodea atripinnis]|uniref:Secreted protein n=1 Tax=Goodea atripinnis TaxID=208336 RepID=A0ABV0NLF2_9TELE